MWTFTVSAHTMSLKHRLSPHRSYCPVYFTLPTITSVHLNAWRIQETLSFWGLKQCCRDSHFQLPAQMFSVHLNRSSTPHAKHKLFWLTFERLRNPLITHLLSVCHWKAKSYLSTQGGSSAGPLKWLVLFCFNYFFSRQLSRFHTLFCTVRKSSQSKTIRPVFSSHSDILVITTATLGINKQTLEAASTNQRDPGLCTTCKQQGLKALSDHKLLLNRQLCFPGCGSLQRQPTRMRPGAILSSLSASTTCPKLRQGGQPRLLLRWQKAALCF